MGVLDGKPPKRSAKVWEAASYLEGRSSVTVTVGYSTVDLYDLAVVVQGGARVWEVRYSGSRPKGKPRWRVAEVGKSKTKDWQGKARPALVRRRYFATAKEAADYLIGELRGVGL